MMRRRSRPVLVPLLAVLLVGCTVGPNYVRPALAPPATFRGEVIPPAATSIADLPWWDAFGDPALKRLISEAVTGNYDLRIAAARVQQARAQAGIARAGFFPTIGYDANVQRSKNFAAFLGI